MSRTLRRQDRRVCSTCGRRAVADIQRAAHADNPGLRGGVRASALPLPQAPSAVAEVRQRRLHQNGAPMSTTGCTVSVDDFHRWHDYSQTPHNTAETPRRAGDIGPCQTSSSDGKLGWCEHVATYEVVVYQIATHDWVILDACFPCADSIKRRNANLGPRGSTGVHSIRSIRMDAE